MATISADQHVAALVLEEPARARVFERFGIDYCCGGGVPLATACAERGLDVDDVVDALAEPGQRGAEDVDWTSVPLTKLVAHIVDEHHAYLREELPALGALAEKVRRAHGEAHPELVDVHETFEAVSAELDRHLADEEAVLFPACIALEAEGAGSPIAEPIVALRHDHEEVGAGLSRLRALTDGYTPPIDACNSYRALYARLETFERDTHRHVHEENNVLFPRALALQGAVA